MKQKMPPHSEDATASQKVTDNTTFEDVPQAKTEGEQTNKPPSQLPIPTPEARDRHVHSKRPDIRDMLKNMGKKRPAEQQDNCDLASKVTHNCITSQENTRSSQQSATSKSPLQHETWPQQQQPQCPTRKVAKTNGQKNQCTTLTVLTHNLMGTTTMLEETALTATKYTPDVMINTETKLTDKSNKDTLKSYLHNYQMYHSCKASPRAREKQNERERSRAGSAGVNLAVHEKFLTKTLLACYK